MCRCLPTLPALFCGVLFSAVDLPLSLAARQSSSLAVQSSLSQTEGGSAAPLALAVSIGRRVQGRSDCTSHCDRPSPMLSPMYGARKLGCSADDLQESLQAAHSALVRCRPGGRLSDLRKVTVIFVPEALPRQAIGGIAG